MTGTRYELRAAQYLTQQGYRVLQQNYRCRFGEIDLIAMHEGYLVFIEVKYRADGRAGCGSEAVDRRKQHRIARAALCYLYERHISDEQPCRFDVLSFLGEQISLIQNAFEI